MAQVQIIHSGSPWDHVSVLGGPTPDYPDTVDEFGLPILRRAGDLRAERIEAQEDDQIRWLHRHGLCIDERESEIETWDWD